MDKPIYSKQIDDVALNPLISRSAKALYSVLCTFRNTNTNTCWPGNETLCEALGTSRDYIADWLKELVKHEVISIEITTHYKNKHKVRVITFLHNYSDYVKSM